MTMKIRFENDFQQKIMVQVFDEPVSFTTKTDVLKWRAEWTNALKSWHSPYKVIVDLSKTEWAVDDAVKLEIKTMLRFFEGLFLKSIVGFHPNPTPEIIDVLPFPIEPTFEGAQVKAGVRDLSGLQKPADFRGSIQFQNHFAQHVIELSFSDDAMIDSKEKIQTLKSKLTNNLMQWHSKWSLLIDCTKVEFSEQIASEWGAFEKYFSAFFMKTVIGYSPKHQTSFYPFKVYRSRHKAVAELEAEGHFMGNDARCRSGSK